METLYRKYRPQTFEQVVGQKPIVETLERAVEEQKLSHAYLFCGPRGTGKTTMARLVAKSFVCALGSGKLPDGTCEPCVLVARGLHPDIYELDAASRTGVDAVREEIVNRVDFAPVQARGKVYIIDEVHMLTTAAFNALLKTLEEPPSHVIFILCTTDPQKIPSTVLSRVQRFDFKNIDQADMVAHLEHVSAAEGWTAEKPAVALQSKPVAAKPAPAQAEAPKPDPTQPAAVASVPAQTTAVEPVPAQTVAPETPLAQAEAPEPAQKQQTIQEEDEDLLSMATEIFGEGVKVFSQIDKE